MCTPIGSEAEDSTDTHFNKAAFRRLSNAFPVPTVRFNCGVVVIIALTQYYYSVTQ